MMFDPREKIALFIDGANLYEIGRASCRERVLASV